VLSTLFSTDTRVPVWQTRSAHKKIGKRAVHAATNPIGRSLRRLIILDYIAGNLDQREAGAERIDACAPG
jgi:hypothetical protein